MTDEEKLLELLNKVLFYTEQLSEALKEELEEIENPKISTNASKRSTIERMRLVNSVLFSGEKTKENLEARTKRKTKKMR